ncbi:hypothetical protein Cgig2_000290 [Carnegiea gigantea]|uniref:Uncharacterized protein n=1 Tax=Carnegiea gigantea TaxID=171969 RepID=A0A9Q1GJD9_9CARY|nr:hypothetical protein Cgig2_000290 [Carnegiea gigantea]
MTTCSFSSMVAQLKEAQIEAVRSMGFTSFLKIDVKQIPMKFSKWLVESFDPYVVYFKLLEEQKFHVTTFDVYLTLGVPIGGKQIVKINKAFIDEKYEENRYYSRFILKHVMDVIQITSPNWCQFILDKLISIVRHYKESKAAKRQPNKDNGGPSFSPTLALDQLGNEALTLATTSMTDTIPTTTFTPSLNTGDKKDNDNEDDNGGAPLRFPLRSNN